MSRQITNGEKVSVVEVQARPAGAATGGVGSRAITGGNTTTIRPALVCMRTGNTGRRPRDHLHVRPIHTAGARAVYRTWSVRQGLARMMPAARSTAVPCLERVLCPLCLVCWFYRGQCIVHGAAAAPATPAATLGTHALVPLHPLEAAAGCVRQGPLRMRTFCWRVCAFDFV